LPESGHLDSLHKLYELIHISTEVYNEVVIAGAGMPGAGGSVQGELDFES